MVAVDLPDVNVWVALSSPSHVHFARAQRYWNEEAAGQVAFCTQTVLGLVRVLSLLPDTRGRLLSVTLAWNVYQEWRQEDGVLLAFEPTEHLDALDRLVEANLVWPRTWSDAYLTAFALASGYRLVTFDSDFLKFPNLNLLHLKA